MILLISPKNKYATNRLIEEAKNLNINLAAFDVKEIYERGFLKVDPSAYSALFIRFPHPFYAQIIELAQRFKKAGKKVVDDSITSGDVGLGKMKNYEQLVAAGLPIPKTEWLSQKSSIAHPKAYIVKWMYGFKGREVFYIESEQDLAKVLDRFDIQELMEQEYIEADAEYKIITVGYKSLPVILKFPINKKTRRVDLGKGETITVNQQISESANQKTERREYAVSLRGPRLGGATKQSEQLDSGIATPPDRDLVARNDKLSELISIAEKASEVTKRELAKVDILEKNGNFYILEVNRWPGFESFEKLSGCNVAKAFVEYLEL